MPSSSPHSDCNPCGTQSRRRELLLLAASAAVPAATLPARAAAGSVIRHGMGSLQPGRQPAYWAQVLLLMLEKSRPRFGDYSLQYVGATPQGRSFAELEQGRLDVLPAMTSIEREQRALPVRYCLYRGLMGLRVGVGQPAQVARLEGVRNLDALRHVALGQSADWPDFEILKAAGLQVVRLASLLNGVARLKLGSFDLMPLSIAEAQPIAAQHTLALVAEWAIAYPTAYYMFASPQQPTLAQRLQYGFEMALADGSFEALFAREIGPLVKAARLDHRHLLRLPNPLLPEATPLGRAELWHPALRQGQAPG